MRRYPFPDRDPDRADAFMLGLGVVWGGVFEGLALGVGLAIWATILFVAVVREAEGK